MKKIYLVFLLLPTLLNAQHYSWEGFFFASNSKIHYLNIFVNIIYDVHPDTNNIFLNNQYWPSVTDPTLAGINNTAIPTYLLDWMDTVYVPGSLHGSCTRLYGESSFDSLQITGDFVVVNMLESSVLEYGAFKDYYILRCVLDILKNNPFETLFGHYTYEDFDKNHDGIIDQYNILIRNVTKAYGDINPGSGQGGFNTMQCVGDGNFFSNPTNIVTHEISHGLFGLNNFHTSGGNHRGTGGAMPFLNLQCGYGLMGAANSGLVCCNGYERWRMHWKHPQSVDYISARDSSNTVSVVSDVMREDGNRTFLLRDFITHGDAVRIKLPYKDSETSSNQYIWLENHRIGTNGKLDFLQYSNMDDYSCRPAGSAGIYAYYQVGRDILEGSNNAVWDTCHRDNLKIIPADGFYDFEKVDDSYYLACVAGQNRDYTLIRGSANPFCGAQDQEWHLFPAAEDTILYTDREFAMWRKSVNGQNDDSLPFIGDNHDAFSSYTHINMGTNPSTCNVRTFHSTNYKPDTIIAARCPEKNVRNTYLTGLGIEMAPVGNAGDMLVRIRWDDYDITDNPRWTGSIILRDTAILTNGHTITLAQNRTVAQATRHPETGLFAERTTMTCTEGSLFRQEAGSCVSLTESSSLVLDSSSRYEMTGGAQLSVNAGCTLSVSRGADLRILDSSAIVVDSLGYVILRDSVLFGSSARIIVRPGGKLVVDGGTLTAACDAEMWPGITVLGHPDKRQWAQYQGKVELRNGAVIEHALCGVTLGADEDDTQHTGGILTATDASFLNCARAIHFRPYADSFGSMSCCRANTSACTRCTFVVDSGNRFAQSNVTFNEHVLLQDVLSVKFAACTLCNVGYIGSSGNCGFRALGASFSLSDDRDPQYPSVPDSSIHRSLLSGFFYGVYATSTSWGMGPGFYNTVFRNNTYGAYLHGCLPLAVKRCVFHLDSLPYFSLRPTITGVYLSNGYWAEFEADTFTRASYSSSPSSKGIYATNNSMGDVIVYHNLFENLNFGIYTNGNNGDSTGGLQFACNEFQGDNYGVYILPSSTVAMTQKYRGYAAGNTFTGTMGYGIYNGGPQVMHYYNGSSNIDPSLIYGSVTQHTGAPVSGCFFSWDTILPIVPPDPIKTEGDSTGDNAPQDSPKVLMLGNAASGAGADDVVIYPNPNGGRFTVNRVQGTVDRVQVYDVYGKLLKTVEVNANTAELDVRELASGMYFVRIHTEKGVVTKSFVKK